MEKVYLVHHIRDISEDDDIQDVKLIGVYTTEELAEEAVERKKKLEGFRDYREGFEISKTTLNEDIWTSGFISIEEAVTAIKIDEN